MKKFLALLVSVMMIMVMLASCGGGGGEEGGGEETASMKVGLITLHDENSTYDLNFLKAF
jgi:basic membrane protein A